ncbi:MAG: GDP-mannose 4,6-dehydratase [Nanoarchaeota archaeon]
MKSLLVIGGTGFIGSNAVASFLKDGWDVTVLDNLSRKGTKQNLEWLQKNYPNVKFIKADICTDQSLLDQAVEGKDAVLHLAAQVAVTTSVTDPRTDFEINALGTFNVLEAIRKSKARPIILYSSTNKVYGGMEDVEVIEKDGRYVYKDFIGASEERILDFHSPYGCSKGAADQYVRDYARIYGLRTIVFRQSCIYGYRQFGIEDQGWVAWFTIAALLDKKLTIYGDGKQVRDVLFIDDLVQAYKLAIAHIATTSGQVYNIGGGPNFQMSLLELLKHLEKQLNKKIPYTYADWRPGDQKVFVCDIKKAKKDFGWEPKVGVEKGVSLLADWVKENKELFM